jgi:hypothetical protein
MYGPTISLSWVYGALHPMPKAAERNQVVMATLLLLMIMQIPVIWMYSAGGSIVERSFSVSKYMTSFIEVMKFIFGSLVWTAAMVFVIFYILP